MANGIPHGPATGLGTSEAIPISPSRSSTSTPWAPSCGASIATLIVPYLWVADAGTGAAKGHPGSTAFVGKASIEAEALDSVSGDQVAAYVETEIPKKYNWTHGLAKGVTSYTDAYSTWAYTKEAMDIWAKHIRERMDAVHGK